MLVTGSKLSHYTHSTNARFGASNQPSEADRLLKDVSNQTLRDTFASVSKQRSKPGHQDAADKLQREITRRTKAGEYKGPFAFSQSSERSTLPENQMSDKAMLDFFTDKGQKEIDTSVSREDHENLMQAMARLGGVPGLIAKYNRLVEKAYGPKSK